MLARVLVAYATQYGSTEDVADVIAAAFCNMGQRSDLVPATAVKCLDGYNVVVLGTPIYIGHLHRDAHKFLTTHKEALQARSVAIFALGPLNAAEFDGSKAQFDKELAEYDWLKPVATRLFVGKYDPAVLNVAHRLLANLPASPLHGQSAIDRRDWDAIFYWATGVARLVAA